MTCVGLLTTGSPVVGTSRGAFLGDCGCCEVVRRLLFPSSQLDKWHADWKRLSGRGQFENQLLDFIDHVDKMRDQARKTGVRNRAGDIPAEEWRHWKARNTPPIGPGHTASQFVGDRDLWIRKNFGYHHIENEPTQILNVERTRHANGKSSRIVLRNLSGDEFATFPDLQDTILVTELRDMAVKNTKLNVRLLDPSAPTATEPLDTRATMSIGEITPCLLCVSVCGQE